MSNKVIRCILCLEPYHPYTNDSYKHYGLKHGCFDNSQEALLTKNLYNGIVDNFIFPHSVSVPMAKYVSIYKLCNHSYSRGYYCSGYHNC